MWTQPFQSGHAIVAYRGLGGRYRPGGGNTKLLAIYVVARHPIAAGLSPLQATGAIVFGVVVGWITYRTLRRSGGANHSASMSDLAAVIGAIGGSVVTGLFKNADLFACYSIGLAGGFFGYLAFNMMLDLIAPAAADVSKWNAVRTTLRSGDDP
ncbi:MAG TPA: hypothetical protein VFB34_03175 [Chloroflexota bacterium]|nr:hypothetical protein [Chloroflexota bacterium]